MGNMSCCQADTINQAQQLVISQDQDPKLLAGIQFINLLEAQVQHNFFINYRRQEGIQKYIGINVQNLSSLYSFVKQIKSNQKQLSNNQTDDNKKIMKEAQLNTQCQIIIDEVKTALFQLKKNTKKNVKSLDINETKNLNNYISFPYYLPWIETQNSSVCVYIGQWMYQSKFLHKNFPYGFGRLYINNQVWQGQIHPSIQKLQQLNHATIQQIKKLLDNPLSSIEMKKNSIQNNFVLQLNGHGRKFTKEDEYCGQFSNGMLNGKGQYKNFKLQYSYEGSWLDNVKHGKGIQKTKLTRYQGSWNMNKKNGEGTLIFHISAQQQKQRLKQQKIFDQLNQKHKQYKSRKARVKIDMNLEQISDRQVKQTLLKQLPKYKGQQLLTFQNKSYSPWQIEQFPFINKTFVQNLKFQQMMKTNFLQKYVGQFTNDLFHGKGMYQWAKGNFYVGDWVQGKMQGIGKFYWKQGYTYYGQYKNDMKHGKGQMKWDPYKRHRGNWAFGKKHGYGQQIKIQFNQQTKNLQIIITSGLWKNNILDPKDKFWSKSFSLENDPHYIKYSRILLHNIVFYTSDKKLSQQMRQQIIIGEAKNYFANPCKFCGSYIKKQQIQDDQVWKGVFSIGSKQNLSKQTDQNGGPQACIECTIKLKQLQQQQEQKNNIQDKKS